MSYRKDFHIKFGDGREVVESGETFGEARDKALANLPNDVKTVHVTVSTMGNVIERRTMIESHTYCRTRDGWRVSGLAEETRRGHRLFQHKPKDRT